jgi:hypothetical protein
MLPRPKSSKSQVPDALQRSLAGVIDGSTRRTISAGKMDELRGYGRETANVFAFILRSKPFHSYAFLVTSGYKANRITETYS